METISTNGLTIFFEAEEQEAAELICQACEKSARLIRRCWGLDRPKDCRVYVMTSWGRFIFHSAPWPWWILVGLSMPLWYFRVKNLWQYAGGWAQRYGQRQAVGIKPPRLIQLADKSIGDQIFIKEDDVRKKVQHITCHELTHAFAAHLKLPMWLNEGLAMMTVDRFFEKTTLKYETLDVLERSSAQTSPERYRKLRIEDQDRVVYHYVRGYWLTRYIEDTRPELLKNLLSQRHSHQALENKVATAYDMNREEFWTGIDQIVASHFK